MKRILMLRPYACGSGDTTENNIYNIIDDKLYVYEGENQLAVMYDYNKINIEKYPEEERWITIEDDTSEDSFEVEKNEDRFIIFENDKDLAHELINRIDGLASTIVNMVTSFKN